MKQIVRVSTHILRILYSSKYYVDRAQKYNIKCTMLRYRLGFFRDRFLLKLEGSEENIQMFLNYLKNEGFTIEEIQSS